MPNRVNVEGKMRNIQNRKYCLECSPFGKHNTKQLHKPESNERVCPKCECTKHLSEFYNKRGKKGSSSYCKECTKTQTTVRQRQIKVLCLEYKGGSCEKCGYSKCIAALEFHHKDPAQKDPSFGNFKLRQFNDKFKEELDKCLLLCANCHREEHHFKN